jgi:diguanylate cyclase (GGDEF)-like protein
MLLQDSLELLGATVARLHLPTPEGTWRLEHEVAPKMLRMPPLALELEAALLPRAIAARKSLISTHPSLDPDLADLAARCRDAKVTTHLLLIRAHQQTYGAVGMHWLGVARPVDYDGRSVFYTYWDNAGLAVATAAERERRNAELEQLRWNAFTDRLTGLPNDQALQRELEANEDTWPLSVLVLDFDGLRAANAAFGNRDGGDVLIAAVGAELSRLAAPNEYAARMYTAGDEFAVLLPRQDEHAALTRRVDFEVALDAVLVPERLASIYRGASVGTATRVPGETPGQTLGRAIMVMRARKRERQESASG